MSEEKGIVIKQKHIIVILISIALLIALAVILGMNWNNWFGGGNAKNTGGDASSATTQVGEPDIDPDAGKWSGGSLEDKDGATQGIKIPGYPSITLPANSTQVSVALLNPEGNPCYFVFELVLSDSGESLYKSKLVPPGQAITSITMSKPLEAGQHDAVIKITTYSLEDQAPMNGANVETVLIAK